MKSNNNVLAAAFPTFVLGVAVTFPYDILSTVLQNVTTWVLIVRRRKLHAVMQRFRRRNIEFVGGMIESLRVVGWHWGQGEDPG